MRRKRSGLGVGIAILVLGALLALF
ncbi:MAG: hypothetical protein QOF77_2317, partial [Solirubrobacteraceae bacterium]|nr:hypothetical protein [Solirubrobacteraceae bacterium]